MNYCLATYIHDLSPFLIRFSENFGVRWYGFMYVLGFIASFFLIRWFVRLRICELKEDKVSDFITIVAILGVMVGGRLGYMLFYNRDEFFGNPLTFFHFLDGGMSSHGAIFGLVFVTWLCGRWFKVSWLGLGDNLVICGVLGVFFGRIGNFINGELYGRITDHKWAMKFPDEMYRNHNLFPSEKLLALVERGKDIAPELRVEVNNLIANAGGFPRWEIIGKIIETSRENEAFKLMLGEILNPRHPSQIYQALCEGLLVFTILMVIRLMWKNAWHGFISGVFFILYAIARISVENLRQPDSSYIMGMTKGQFYSIFMIVTGLVLIGWSLYTKRTNQIADK